MRVGHAVARVDVEVGAALGGYISRPRVAAGTHDAIEVHAIAVHQPGSGRALALVTLDILCVNDDLVGVVRAAARELGFDECWVAATHTHSGPDVGWSPKGALTPPGWLERLGAAGAAALSEAAAAAASTEGAGECRTVTVSSPVTVRVHGVGGPRSEAEVVVEVPVDALVFRDEGAVVGTIVVLPVHATVLGPTNVLVSADLAGAVRAGLQRELGGWVVLFSGAAGDISTRFARREQSFTELERLAGEVVDQILPSIRDARPADGDAFEASSVDIPGFTAVRTLRLGDALLVAVPGEPSLWAWGALRSRSSGAIVLGCTNGYRGYLPPRSAFAAATYEALMSSTPEGTLETLCAAVIASIGEVVAESS